MLAEYRNQKWWKVISYEKFEPQKSYRLKLIEKDVILWVDLEKCSNIEIMVLYGLIDRYYIVNQIIMGLVMIAAGCLLHNTIRFTI